VQSRSLSVPCRQPPVAFPSYIARFPQAGLKTHSSLRPKARGTRFGNLRGTHQRRARIFVQQAVRARQDLKNDRSAANFRRNRTLLHSPVSCRWANKLPDLCGWFHLAERRRFPSRRSVRKATNGPGRSPYFHQRVAAKSAAPSACINIFLNRRFNPRPGVYYKV